MHMVPIVYLLSLLGLLLPPRFSTRLGLAGIILGLIGWLYSNTPNRPGIGHSLGMAVVFGSYAVFLGAIFVGLLVRGLWATVFRSPKPAQDHEIVPVLDWLLVALFMALPAGVIGLTLGTLLAGSGSPLGTHVALLSSFAATAAIALRWIRGAGRAALLGLAVWLGLITGDSLRLDSQLRAELARYSVGQTTCLAIGPDAVSLDNVPRLMGLTAPKPILLVTWSSDLREVRRWSFRYHGFVRTGIDPETIPCPVS